MKNAIDLISIPIGSYTGIRPQIIEKKIEERNADGWRLLGPVAYADIAGEGQHVILTWVKESTWSDV